MVGVDWQKAFTNEFNPTFCEHSAAFYQALFLYLANISSVIYVPNTVLCIEGTVQRNVPIKGFIVPGGNYPAGIYSPRSCPAVPSSLSLCCLRSSVLQSRVGMFPLSPPSPAALVWPCGPGRHAGGGERRPLRLRGGARLEAADGFRLKFLTVSLKCALTSFHLLSSFLEDFFFFFLRDCLLSHWDIIDNTALYFGVQDNDLIYVYIVKWSSQ